MKTTQNIFKASVFLLLLTAFFACAPVQPPSHEAQQEEPAVQAPTVQNEAVIEEIVSQEEPEELSEGQLPVRFQQPEYLIKENEESFGLGLRDEEIIIPVGADISSTTGPVALRDILKRLAALKNMNVSWASDVDQFALVDVDIRAEDDFFQAIDNILRQMDYYHEVKDNTIIVKYRETRKFHIAMPFMASKYNTEVGGDVLGAGGTTSEIKGNIQITSTDNEFDIWENIKTNLDQILEIWEETIPVTPPETSTASPSTETEAVPVTITRRNVQGGKGYYTIDKPIGLITVTAPRPLVEKIALYLNNLKAELYRQIAIEAKIIEVTLDDSETKGINWNELLSQSVRFELFGPSGIIYQPGTSERVVSKVSLPNNPFDVIIDALESQGETKVLANPKISVMNGQPAMISVGDSQKYIDSVSATVDEGVVTYSVTTSSVMSGLGMAVVATVLEDNEIILTLTPVTSEVEEPIEYIEFGAISTGLGGSTVGLPKVNIREMNTIVKIKNGDMLVIGGLIDNKEETDTQKVPLLGDIPGVNRLFSHETKRKTKKELVILLQPKIIS